MLPNYSLASGIGRALRRRCPVCGDGDISRHPAAVEQHCRSCGLDLERQVGSFIGGIGLNTIIGFACLIVVLVAGFLRTGGQASVSGILLPALAVAVTVPLWCYARSRLVWVALELRWWPLEPGEVHLDAERRDGDDAVSADSDPRRPRP